MSETQTVRALAKLTLRLKITGVRADGYHELDAEMVTLALADTLSISPAPETSITIGGPFASGVPNDASNLVWRALEAVGRSAAVEIDKRIPHGGGLGGGSADAAAILRWAGCTEVSVAASLGADVPFALAGGRAHVTGIGDVLRPLPMDHRGYTIITPPLVISTVDVYRMWDRIGGPTSGGPNDLEAAACAVEPSLSRWRDRIEEAAGCTPTLAGSGSSWFLAGHYPELIAALPDAAVFVTRSQEPATFQ